MPEERAARIAALAALAEPTRRRLYELVARSPRPVSRDDASAALGIPRATAAFHLDRLAADGLLEVGRERRTGRSGPGAGRPAKLYRRSAATVAVSLPERRYDLAGELLAGALEEAERTGERPAAVLGRRAREVGEQLGRTAGRVTAALEACGFEPRDDDGAVVLANCPFHALAAGHTQLVCGMNLQLLRGLLAGAGEDRLGASLAPADGLCCVRLDPLTGE
jgi:predicted ArsR family transcriptional regulator